MRQGFLIGILFIVLILQLQTLHAVEVQSHSGGLNAVKNVDIILNANPPLPMLEYQPGNYRLTVQPSYYYGTNEFADFTDNPFSGVALAFNYTQVRTDRWGWYVSGLLVNYSADMEIQLPFVGVELNDIRGNLFTVGGGVHYLLLTQQGYRPALVFIGGPYVKIARFSQTFFQEGAILDDGSFSNEVVFDFDMESNPVLFGLTVGGRLSWRIKDKFALNFFGFMQVPITSECQPYKVTAVRTDFEGDVNSGLCESGGDGGIDFSGNAIELAGAALSGGFNIEYIPWKVTLNVSAPIIKALVEDYTQQDTTVISLSKSFGGNASADSAAK